MVDEAGAGVKYAGGWSAMAAKGEELGSRRAGVNGMRCPLGGLGVGSKSYLRYISLEKKGKGYIGEGCKLFPE